ncbi:MAG: SRPBCC family protein [Pseudomonadota bacterium]
MKIMKRTAYSLGTLAALTAATLALPRHVSVERSSLIDASPSEILALAASNAGYQRFNPYQTIDPDLEVAFFGPASGVGSGFHFDSRDGTGSQIVAEVTQTEVFYVIDLGRMGQPTQSIAAVATEAGTEVTWRMQSDMRMNPVFRVFGLFMDGMMGPTFELGLENLAEAAA